MDEETKALLRETLTVFRTGVQLAVTISCFAVGASLGAVIVSGSKLAGTFWGLALVLLIGTIAGATASYWMFRAESGKTQPPEDKQGEHRGYQSSNEADYSRSNF